MSERSPSDLINRPSLLTMATVSVCPKIMRINSLNAIFLSKYCLRGSIKQIDSTGDVPLENLIV